MFYTYGYKPTYDELLERNPSNDKIKKLGYREKYEYPDGTIDVYYGGGVWETPEQARQYIESKPSYITDPNEWGVYIIDGDWNTDVFYIDGEPYYRLKIDKPIIGKHNV